MVSQPMVRLTLIKLGIPIMSHTRISLSELHMSRPTPRKRKMRESKLTSTTLELEMFASRTPWPRILSLQIGSISFTVRNPLIPDSQITPSLLLRLERVHLLQKCTSSMKILIIGMIWHPHGPRIIQMQMDSLILLVTVQIQVQPLLLLTFKHQLQHLL